MPASDSGSTPPPARPVVLAAIGRPHGLTGELCIRQFNPESNSLDVGQQVWMAGPGVASRWVTVTGLRGEYLRLEGIGDRTQAEAVRGAELSVDRSTLPETDEDEFYLHDLIGCEVIDAAGRKLGTLKGLQVSGTKEYFVVQGAREVLLPAGAPILGAVDLAGATLRLNVEVEPEDEPGLAASPGSKG